MLFDEYRLCKAFEERLKSGEIFTTEDFITVDDGEAVIESVSGLGSGLIIKKQVLSFLPLSVFKMKIILKCCIFLI